MFMTGTYMNYRYHEPIWVWRDDITGTPTWTSNARFNGDARDAWHPDGNNLFSPWSNPAARFGDYNPALLPGAMQVLAENSDGSVRVRFYTTDLADLPPSLPQAFHGTTTSGFDGIAHPQFTWEKNIEPGVLFAGTVEVWRQLQPYGEAAGAWTLVQTFPIATESYVDESIAGARQTGGGSVARYRIRVVDGGGMTSNYTREWAMYYGDNPLKTVRHETGRPEEAAAIVARRIDDDIVVSAAHPADIAIRLYDMLGRAILAPAPVRCAGAGCRVPLATSTIPAGRYCCVVYADGVPATQVPVVILH
jgi:hypothetical protein